MTQISPKIKRQEYLHITVRFKITADIIFICSNYPPQHCSRNNSSHIYQITNVFHCRMRSMIQLPLLISKSTNIDFKWKSYIFYLFSAIYILCGVSNKMDTMRIIQILFFRIARNSSVRPYSDIETPAGTYTAQESFKSTPSKKQE